MLGTEIESDGRNIFEVEANSVGGEVGDSNTNRAELVSPSRTGSKTGPFVRSCYPPVHTEVDRASPPRRVAKRYRETQGTIECVGLRMPRSLCNAEGQEPIAREVAL